ncbi:MAG TPA: redoxin domain-containing protein, partial [Candidatus Binataceae bacterium]|nr:redoxin domain-containing protein [Candidatus Binataceae bacterium]
GTFVNGRRIKAPAAVRLGDEIRFGDAAFVLAKPAASAVGAGKRVLPRKVLTLRGACELVLIAFAIGFGAAEYLAYLEYHAQNRLVLAEAVPMPAPASLPAPLVKVKPPAVQAPPQSASSPSVPAKTKAEAPTSKPVIAGTDSINARELAGSVALAQLIRDSGRAAGESAPNFILANLDGTKESLSAMRGKVVLLNFWATWCPACRSEIPSLEELYHDFRSNPDFAMLTVNIDQKGRPAVSQFMEANGYDLPVLLDPGNSTSEAYGVNGIPSTFVIGRSGQILWNCPGALDWSNPDIRSALKKLL